MKHKKVIIVGGGLAGLYAAYSLEQNNIHLNHVVTKIEKEANLWQLTVTINGIEQTFSTDELMLAMPPRIIASTLPDKQWVSRLLQTRL